MDLAWMAWTKATALFFCIIFSLIFCMGIWERFVPGGSPRVGILRFETTRGDRLFISLLGSAYINLFWLGLIGTNLWWAIPVCLLYALCVFIWV